MNTFDIYNVDWKPYYRLSQASIGQIIRTFINIYDKLENSKNVKLRDLLYNLILKYTDILYINDYVEQNVIYYNLIVNLPKGMNIQKNKYGYIKLGNAKINLLIECIKQRINFIINRKVPIPKNLDSNINIDDYINQFNKLKTSMINYLQVVNEFETEYYKLLN